tara:strand:- start:11 stop:559 length:549 start_codon:yes stop_codon:yes gene_type:complete
LFETTNIPGLILVTPKKFDDDRGYFSEVYNLKRYSTGNLDHTFVQDNQSFNVKKSTIRGLHFQPPPSAQDKLVRVGQGSVMDVAVDIRKSSKYFGKYFKVKLSAENRKQLFIPKGFMHGFVSLEDNTELLYKCSDFYAPEHECTVRFDDPDLNIDWDQHDSVLNISDKDLKGVSFKDLSSPF